MVKGKAEIIDFVIVIGAVILFVAALIIGLFLIREFYGQSQCYGESNPWCLKGYKCNDVVCNATCDEALLNTKPGSTLDPCCVSKYPGRFTMPVYWYCMDPDVNYAIDPLCNKGYNFCSVDKPCPSGYTCTATKCVKT